MVNYDVERQSRSRIADEQLNALIQLFRKSWRWWDVYSKIKLWLTLFLPRWRLDRQECLVVYDHQMCNPRVSCETLSDETKKFIRDRIHDEYAEGGQDIDVSRLIPRVR